MQSLEPAQGPSRKRSRAIPDLASAELGFFSAENDDSSSFSLRKRLRKSTQLSRFSVYQNANSATDSDKFSAYEEFTPALIGQELGKIWPHIRVEIPFRPEIHQNSADFALEKGSRTPLAVLSSIALNGARKAPKIPENWLEKQPNDHTSKLL
jgi:hypothetical protein